MAKPAKNYIVSANDLLGGEVVYLGQDGRWTETLAEAAVSEDSAALLAKAEGANALRQAIDIAAIVVTLGADGMARPVALRELIRERGPTNRPDLGRQAAQPLQR